MNLLGEYINGNYFVRIYGDGTKIRENDLDVFIPEYPESMDLKITNSCDMICAYCHEDSKPDGRHGDILHLPFLDSLLPYTEIAIGGGNPLSHPDLVPFLKLLRERKLIPNITVNQAHFLKNIPLLQSLTEQGLLFGLGVSFSYVHGEQMQQLIDGLRKFPNAVLHVINGVVSIKDLESIAGKNFKVLILGYKDFRRGVFHHTQNTSQISANQECLYKELPRIIQEGWFDVVSFDNLAIKQLNVQRLMSKDAWDRFYMGDDGTFTMYVDAVNWKYAVSSVSENRYDITDDITQMFETVRKEKAK